MLKIQQINFRAVNAYLLQSGAQFMLIDSGLPPLWRQLNTALQQAGCSPENLKLAIFTHGDMDHTGNAQTLKQMYGASIAIHNADAPLLRDGVSLKRTGKKLGDAVTIFMAGTLSRTLKRVTPDILLEDGQRLDAYGLPAVVLHVPGHTPGSIAILTDEGDLFSGDMLVNQRRPAMTGLVENQSQMAASLEKLKQTGARRIYPGHGMPFEGTALTNIQVD